MKNYSTILCFTIVTLAFGSGSVRAQDKLQSPTYMVGKEYSILIDQDMEMDMSAMAKAVGQPEGAGQMKTKMTMEMVASCQSHSVAGQKIVKTRFANIKMDMNSMGMNMSYDSTKEGSANSPLGQAMAPMIGKEFSIIFDANDEVVAVEGFDEIAGAGNPGAPKLFDADQLKQMMNPALQLGIPDGGVSVGEKWKNEMDLNFGSQMGKMNTNFDLEYVSDETVDGANCAVVNYDAVMSMELNPEGGSAASPVKMKMDSSKMKGTMKMDKALRYARLGTAEMDMTMIMTNPADPTQNIQIPAKIKQNFKLTSVKDI